MKRQVPPELVIKILFGKLMDYLADGVHNIVRDTAIDGILLAGQDGGHDSTRGGSSQVVGPETTMAQCVVSQLPPLSVWSLKLICQSWCFASSCTRSHPCSERFWDQWETLRRLDCQVDGEDRTRISLAVRSTNLSTCRR